MADANVTILSSSTVPEICSNMIGATADGTRVLDPEYVEPIINSVIEGLASSAKELKNKDADVAIILRDEKMVGDFIFGVKIKFIKGEDKDSGSWNTVWSFNAADFDDCNEKYYVDDINAPVIGKIRERMIIAHLRLYNQTDLPWFLAKYAFEAIRDWLDNNAKEGETVTLSSEGKFDATVDVVDGIKIFNFIPDEEITNIAKSDAEI